MHTTRRTAIDSADRCIHFAALAGVFGADPEVVVHASWWDPANGFARGAEGDLYIPVANAAQLAGVIEVLSHAMPEQHLALAAAIRKAAADITEGT